MQIERRRPSGPCPRGDRRPARATRRRRVPHSVVHRLRPRASIREAVRPPSRETAAAAERSRDRGCRAALRPTSPLGKGPGPPGQAPNAYRVEPLDLPFILPLCTRRRQVHRQENVAKDNAQSACGAPRAVEALSGSMSSCPRVAYFCMEYGLDPSFPDLCRWSRHSCGRPHEVGGRPQGPTHRNRSVLGRGVHPSGRRHSGNRGPLSQDAARRIAPCRRRGSKSQSAARGCRCRAWKVDRYVTSTLYLLEPERDEDRWITQRLYGGGVEDRLAQEIVLGVGGVRLLAGARRAGRRLSLQRGPRGVCGPRAAAPRGLRRLDVRGADREAAPACRVHDAHAGSRRQRGPRPRADAPMDAHLGFSDKELDR